MGEETRRVEGEVTPRAWVAFDEAWNEARRNGRNFINTGDLLLGLLSDRSCPASIVLSEFGIDHDQARAMLRMLYVPADPREPSKDKATLDGGQEDDGE